jgi:hypothetical protein
MSHVFNSNNGNISIIAQAGEAGKLLLVIHCYKIESSLEILTETVGDTVGLNVGETVGLNVGPSIGLSVGTFSIGDKVGDSVGLIVGSFLTFHPSSFHNPSSHSPPRNISSQFGKDLDDLGDFGCFPDFVFQDGGCHHQSSVFHEELSILLFQSSLSCFIFQLLLLLFALRFLGGVIC